MSHFTDAAGRSVTVSKTGEGQSGLRTERITLELTHDLDARLSDWIVEVVDESLGLMESVRVVEDRTGTDMGNNVFVASTAEVLAMHEETVARLTAESEQLAHERDIYISNELSALRSWQKALNERDEARRERDALIARAAAAANASLAQEEREAIHGIALMLKRLKLYPHVPGRSQEMDVDLLFRVAEGAPAASGGGEAQGVTSDALVAPEGDSGQGSRVGSGEPVAWGCATPDGRLVHVSTFKPERDTATIVPLYRELPQPRGWLSEDQRGSLLYAIDGLREAGSARNDAHANTLEALLARSSPPEVVLPENPYHPSGLREGFEHAIRIVRNELVNAGVPVKEVGRE
jgi:hypothetical protein